MQDTIADIQSRVDSRNIAIDKVGIKELLHPALVLEPDGSKQHVQATFDLSVSLAPNVKGTHMSRFLQILNADTPILGVKCMPDLVEAIKTSLDAKDVYVSASFPFFVKKKAPVSGIQSLMDYKVKFRAQFKNNTFSHITEVLVPIKSLCPCSKEISDYGAHNQRSHILVKVHSDSVSIFEIIRMVEQQASCEVYGLLKRPDEKYVTEYAYDNPKFVEDLVRDIAHVLNNDNRIKAYQVESENFESIHNHSAAAMIQSSNFSEL